MKLGVFQPKADASCDPAVTAKHPEDLGFESYWVADHTILGGDFEHRWTQIKEAIAAMKTLWTEDPSEFHGKYVDFPAVRCFPKPARKPHPPVLLGSIDNPRALRRVVEWGDGWIPIVASVDEYASGVAEIRERAARKGRSLDSIDLSVFGMEGQWRSP